MIVVAVAISSSSPSSSAGASAMAGFSSGDSSDWKGPFITLTESCVIDGDRDGHPGEEGCSC